MTDPPPLSPRRQGRAAVVPGAVTRAATSGRRGSPPTVLREARQQPPQHRPSHDFASPLHPDAADCEPQDQAGMALGGPSRDRLLLFFCRVPARRSFWRRRGVFTRRSPAPPTSTPRRLTAMREVVDAHRFPRKAPNPCRISTCSPERNAHEKKREKKQKK